MPLSVPKHKRSESPMEFMHNALALQKEVTELLLRDFGISDRIRRRVKDAKLDEQSANILQGIKTRYCMAIQDREMIDAVINQATVEARELDKYPEWLVEYHRGAVLRILEALINNLYAANSIYITQQNAEAEYSQRRCLWNAALGNCYQLAARFDTIRQTIPIDANKYEPYLKRIKREIALIKGVRASDNKVLSKMLQNAEVTPDRFFTTLAACCEMIKDLYEEKLKQ